MPPWRGAAHGYLREASGYVLKLVRARGSGNDKADAAARDAIGQVLWRQQRRRRTDDDAELHGGEKGLPERCLVAEHQHQTVAAACAEAPKEIRDPVRCSRHLREANDRL